MSISGTAQTTLGLRVCLKHDGNVSTPEDAMYCFLIPFAISIVGLPGAVPRVSAICRLQATRGSYRYFRSTDYHSISRTTSLLFNLFRYLSAFEITPYHFLFYFNYQFFLEFSKSQHFLIIIFLNN